MTHYWNSSLMSPRAFKSLTYWPLLIVCVFEQAVLSVLLIEILTTYRQEIYVLYGTRQPPTPKKATTKLFHEHTKLKKKNYLKLWNDQHQFAYKIYATYLCIKIIFSIHLLLWFSKLINMYVFINVFLGEEEHKAFFLKHIMKKCP